MYSFFELVLSRLLNKEVSRLRSVPIGGGRGDYVVLLHGLNRTAASMNKLAQVFEESGYKVINVSFPSRKDPIEILSRRFLSTVIKHQCINHKRKIHFVTHSLSSIILRQYLADNILPNIGNIVMLTPPNHGSKWVDFLKRFWWLCWILGAAGRQLGTHTNSYVNQLPKDFDYKCGVIAATKSFNPFAGLIFKEPHDGTVSVESTKISGMKDFITVATTHCIAPSDQEVIKHTLNFIKFGSFLCGR